MTRHVSSICSYCWDNHARPTAYFPNTTREGTCCACGDPLAIVARVTREEAREAAAAQWLTAVPCATCVGFPERRAQ